MKDQYARNEEESLRLIDVCRSVIPDLLAKENYAWAAKNFRRWSDAHVDLGLLHWRHGLDPRADFEAARSAFNEMRVLAQRGYIEKASFDASLIYTALFLLGEKTEVEFYDAEAVEEYRIFCYRACLVHALHGHALSEKLATVLDRHLSNNNELIDRSFLAYFELLKGRSSEFLLEQLVAAADNNWLQRKRDSSFVDGPPLDGYGAMNEVYVDIFLAGVLKKISCGVDTIHAWKWS